NGVSSADDALRTVHAPRNVMTRARELLAMTVVLLSAMPMCAQGNDRSVSSQGAAATGPADDARTITEDLLPRHVSVIAHDSMRGRVTPSRGLDQTAAYIASQFARLELRP